MNRRHREIMMQAAEFWDQAMDAETYLGQMQQRHDEFVRRIGETEITEADRETFGGDPLRILAITEDWCNDSAQFLPPLVRLDSELPNVEIRFLSRDAHRDLASGYRRKDGYQAIPAIILLDGHGNELGSLIERPQRVYTDLAAETRRFVADNPHLEGAKRTYDKMPDETRRLVKANSDRFRDTRQPQFTRWLFEDLAGILARARAQQPHAAD
jgi:hypothetical protein